MKVLIHQSHHDPTRTDGWSGAPDEARWVREDLIPLIQARLWDRQITSILVPGDLKDHIQFHEPYDAFIAPHYEANTHGEGGAFWGRAANSPTAAADDKLGNLFWNRFKRIPGAPPDRFGWKGINVTDYYGFRLTGPTTPGILVEHGVGWFKNAAGENADFDASWLRNNTPVIASVWGDAIAEFLGIAVTPPAFTPAQEAHRVFEVTEARETLVWLARLQRGLDVERGDAFDPARPPLDARVRK